MSWVRTDSGLAVPVALADLGPAGRPEGIPLAQWNTLSEKKRRWWQFVERGGIGGGGSAPTYMTINGAMPTTAAPSSVTSTTSIKTMLQLKPAIKLRAIEWGASFDGSAAATPGKVEFFESDVAATVTAYAAADVMPWSDAGAAANTAGTSGTPLNLGTTHSGFTSSGEGTTTASRVFDLQLNPPTNGYVKQFPQNREPELQVAKFPRVRVTFAAAINVYCYVIFEV